MKTIIIAALVALLILSGCSTDSFEPQVEQGLQNGVLFVTDRNGRIEFLITSLDGKQQQELHFSEIEDDYILTRPVWSPQLKKWFFSGELKGNSDMFSADWNGSNTQNLTNSPESYESNPVLSPDATSIAFTTIQQDLDIYLMKPDGRNVEVLIDGPSRDYRPLWLPNNNEILFSSNRMGSSNIYMINVKEKTYKNLSQGKGIDSGFALAPDGSFFVFESDREGETDLFRYSLIDGTIENLTRSEGQDLEPVFSPDGHYLAFRSDRDGGWDLFVLEINGRKLVKITNSIDVVESDLSWLPDSSKILFTASTATNQDVMMAGLDRKVTNLSEHPGNDFAPVWVSYE